MATPMALPARLSLPVTSHPLPPPPLAPTRRFLIHFNMGTYTYNGDPSCNPDNWNVKADYADGPSSDPQVRQGTARSNALRAF